MGIALIVHGGAGAITPDRFEAAQEGCREAARIGWHKLQEGHRALDAVEAAVRILEDNPNFNAGTGSCLTAEGNIEMDAGIMEGHTLRVGAIANVERIKNPITLARRVLESPHVLLVGRGAQIFAREHNIHLCRRQDLLTERQQANWQRAHAEHTARMQEKHGTEPIYYRTQLGSTSPATPTDHIEDSDEKHGTVGAVAIDTFGTLAAATSTGGIVYKYPGRIGDSPLVGAGFYADEQSAISCTGYGEDFTRLLIAKRAADFVARGMNARAAAEAAIAVLGAKATGTGGLIVVDHMGNVGFSWNSEHMAYAYMMQDMPDVVTGV